MSLENEGRPPGQRRRLLDDPLAIRALAHPLRLRLMALIGHHERITAAEAGRLLDISQALASHHLRQLAKYGYVEQAEGVDNRARPWRLVATSHSWLGAESTPEGAAASDILEQLIAEQGLADFLDWQERRRDWSKKWHDHAGLGQHRVYLTADELAEIEQAISQVLDAYVEERVIDDIESRPDNSVPVDFTLLITPHGEPPTGD